MKYETQNTGIENMRYDFMPVGSIVPFASDIIPLGWLLCDGRTIERSQYPELYDLIGDKLPDHRGMFLRGNDNGRGIDVGRVLGSEQNDDFKSHKHDMSWNGATSMSHGPSGAGVYLNGPYGYESEMSETGGLETRPKNNSVNYIIKALRIANPSMEYQVADGLNHKIETNRNTIDFNLLATLGISYGGILNNTNPKLVGVAYYDEIARKLFKCIANTSINYADAGYFEAISNNDLNFEIRWIESLKINDNLNKASYKKSIKEYFLELPEHYSGFFYNGYDSFDDLPGNVPKDSFFSFHKSYYKGAGYVVVFTSGGHMCIGTMFNELAGFTWHQIN